MSITPISIASPGLPSIQAAPTRVSGSAPFANLIDRFMTGVGQSHQAADASVQDLVMGKTENMHGVLMQVAQADLNFRLVLEIRNRLIESYQEIMKMQV